MCLALLFQTKAHACLLSRVEESEHLPHKTSFFESKSTTEMFFENLVAPPPWVSLLFFQNEYQFNYAPRQIQQTLEDLDYVVRCSILPPL